MEEPVFRLTKESLKRWQQTAGDPRTVKEMLRSIFREWSDEELRALIYNLERGRGWEAIDTVNPERYLQCLRRSLARHEKAAARVQLYEICWKTLAILVQMCYYSSTGTRIVLCRYIQHICYGGYILKS